MLQPKIQFQMARERTSGTEKHPLQVCCHLYLEDKSVY